MILKVLAPMAGICNAEFCLKLIPYGFNMVTLGGFNVDSETIKAGESILKRGRPEFNIKEENILEYINQETSTIKDVWDGLVSVNLRATSPDPLIEIGNIDSVDVIEINAHCRQEELINIGCGQSLTYDIDHFKEFINEVTHKTNQKTRVSVKIRANIENIDILEVVKTIENSGADYLHIDAMNPGVMSADLNLIQKIGENTDIYIIGNNSIKDIHSAREMLKSGANGISIARAAAKGRLDFNLTEI